MDIGFEGGFTVKRECVNQKIHEDWIPRNGSDKSWVRLRETCFQTVFANDILPYAKVAWNSYFENHLENSFHLESIVDLVKKQQAGAKIFPPRIDVVTGGFPCNDFSVAGYRKGFNSHKSHQGKPLTSLDEPTTENRGLLYMWMREVIELVQPKVFVAENVKGLVSLPDAKTVIENDFRNVGPIQDRCATFLSDWDRKKSFLTPIAASKRPSETPPRLKSHACDPRNIPEIARNRDLSKYLQF